jgi:Glycosyl hydrolase family 12
MTARRRALALGATSLLAAGGVLAVVLLAACSGAGTTTLCHLQSVSVSGGAYAIMNNEWHSGAAQCITTDGRAGFTVVNSSIASRNGTPGGYPFIYKGCHWGACTHGSGLPIQVSGIHPGTVVTSWSTTQPRGSSVYNVAYDIWFNQAPTTAGQPDGAELMIWLNHHGHVHPAGSLVASNVSIGGHDYHVWFRQRGWNTITYTMTTGATSVSHLDLRALVADAVSRGYIASSWYLIGVEAGFELWRGGTGLATNSFWVNVTGGGSP